MRVNNNVFAQNAYRNLSITSGSLGKSLEKLSSGIKINRAGDNAANLAVYMKLRAQTSGLNVAISNSQDGIAVIQTAEGALDRTHAILRRVRDLTEASANGDKTDEDRQKYQAEVDQLLKEIDRISLTTEYNTKKLLNGSLGATPTADESKLNINSVGAANKEILSSVGVNGSVATGGMYTVELLSALDGTSDKVNNAQFAALRASDFAGAGAIGDGTATGTVAGTNWEGSNTLMEAFGMNAGGGETETISIYQPSLDKQASVTLSDSDTITEAVKKIQDVLDAEGMEIDVYWNPDSDMDGALDEGTFQFDARVRGTESNFFISGLNSTGTQKIIGNVAEPADPLLNDATNDGVYEGDGLGAEGLATADLTVRVYDPKGTVTDVTSHSDTFKADFSNMDASKVVDDSGYHQGVQGIEFSLNVNDSSLNWGASAYKVGIDVSGVMTFQAGPNRGDDHRISVAIGDMGTNALGVSGLDVTTQSAAQTAMDSEKIDLAISTVSSQRGALGALQNRLEHTIKNLGVSMENLHISESRIWDTDYAEEMMQFTKNRILMQAGTAMLAQANVANQSVMKLLTG